MERGDDFEPSKYKYGNSNWFIDQKKMNLKRRAVTPQSKEEKKMKKGVMKKTKKIDNKYEEEDDNDKVRKKSPSITKNTTSTTTAATTPTTSSSLSSSSWCSSSLSTTTTTMKQTKLFCEQVGRKMKQQPTKNDDAALLWRQNLLKDTDQKTLVNVIARRVMTHKQRYGCDSDSLTDNDEKVSKNS